MNERLHRDDMMIVGALWLITLSMSGIESLSSIVGMAGIAALIGWSVTRSEREPLADRDTAPWLLFSVVGVAAITLASPPIWFETVQNAALVLPVVALAAFALRIRQTRIWISIGVALIVVVAVSSIWVLGNTVAKEIDIVQVHEAAAEALGDLENPYSVVEFETTSGFDDLQTVEGYPYPPVSLVAYTVGLGAIRVEVLAAIYVGAIVALIAMSGFTIGRPVRSVAAASVLAAIPAMGFMLYSAATEGFTSLLFVGSGLLWRRKPLASAALLGLALASKQYLIVPAVALLMVDIDRRWARIGAGLGAAAVVTLPFVVWDVSAYWTAIFGGDSASPPARPDSVGLGGFGIELPIVVVAAVTVAAMWVLRHRFAGPSAFYWLATIGLALLLIGSPHSLINHWFGVVALMCTALITEWQEVGYRDPDPIDEVATDARAA